MNGTQNIIELNDYELNSINAGGLWNDRDVQEAVDLVSVTWILTLMKDQEMTREKAIEIYKQLCTNVLDPDFSAEAIEFYNSIIENLNANGSK